MANIDATPTSLWNNGEGFVPIGTTVGGEQFTGSFKGNGGVSNTISNLYINRPNQDSVGLFGSIAGGTTQNFEILNANITGGSHSGVLTGWDSGTVTNVDATGTFTANASNSNVSMGGLAGFFSGTMSDSYAGVNVNSNGEYVGGLIGFNSGTVSNSYSTGNVTGGTGSNFVGGLIGDLSSGSITDTYSSGVVSGGSNVGGLLGGNTGTVTASYWDQTLNSSLSSAGGTALTTAQMMGEANFSGWSITNVISTGTTPTAGTWLIFEGSTRPMLSAEWSDFPNTPHQIQLMGMALGATYSLTGNVDMSNTQNSPGDVWAGKGFLPIGNLTSPFTGGFVGNNDAIQNLYINLPSSNFVGLFGIDSGGAIGHVELNNVNITGFAGTGGLVGILENGATATFTNVTGSITSSSGFLGGIAGQVESGNSVTNSSADVTISGTSDLGGIAGENGGTISNSFSTGSITGSGTNIGGLVGLLDNTGSITDSYSSGSVNNGVSSSTVGGLIGTDNSGTVTNSFWDTTTSGQATSSGSSGLAGYKGMSTAAMMTLANFTNTGNGFVTGSGWSITSTPSTSSSDPSNTWFMFNGSTRPILLGEWSTDVTNPYQLQLVGSTLGASYTLGNNISLTSGMNNTADIWGTNQGLNSGLGFAPIGETPNSFSGVLNGNNNTISGLYLNKITSLADNFGMFNTTSSTALIENLNLTGAVLQDSSNSPTIAQIGLLVGNNSPRSREIKIGEGSLLHHMGI